jgi:hypothetical protein
MSLKEIPVKPIFRYLMHNQGKGRTWFFCVVQEFSFLLSLIENYVISLGVS